MVGEGRQDRPSLHQCNGRNHREQAGVPRRLETRQRCILRVDGFYEWQKGPGGKQPYAIVGADGKPLALAGFWEHWKEPGSRNTRRRPSPSSPGAKRAYSAGP
jgi:putative SOS response-associated peptidase YedK